MKQTGKVGIGKVVLRDREDLVALFPYENGLVMQKLHYPNEIRNMKDVPDIEGATKLDRNELKLATTLVEQMVTTLGEIDTVDQYHQALRNLIESKIKGKKVVEFEVEELPRLDIMSALKQSLQQSNRKPMVRATTPAVKKKELTLVKTVGKPVQKAAKKRKAS
jgi:DNA end-binding protein Ku